MTPENLQAFMERNGFSQAELARRLAVSRTTIIAYLSAKQKIPKVFELALEALEKKQ